MKINVNIDYDEMEDERRKKPVVRKMRRGDINKGKKLNHRNKRKAIKDGVE